jgi:phosphotransferase system enzyme I (PtsP)
MSIDHTQLICNISDIASLFSNAKDLSSFLRDIVEMTARHMNSEVCSIYMYDEPNDELVLKATTGLNTGGIDKVRLKNGEGLTGLAFKELRPICERNASKNPHYKYFPELGEEKFGSFLAVPINRGTVRIGVMVIQNSETNFFTDTDINILRAITSQLAVTIEMSRLIITLETGKPFRRVTKEFENKFIHGVPVSPGVVYADALILHKGNSVECSHLKDTNRVFSLEMFRSAVLKTEEQLEQLQVRVEETLSDVASLIFAAQILMLKDQTFLEAIETKMQSGQRASKAVHAVVNDYVERLEKLDNPFLREKAHDVRDIGERLIHNLCGCSEDEFSSGNKIVIARELFPSDILKLATEKTVGVISLSGGQTSHIAILSRSLGLPMVICGESQLLNVPLSEKILLDAEAGNVYIAPSPEILKEFSGKFDFKAQKEHSKAAMKPETFTADGKQVHLLANINLLCDAVSAMEYKAEGVGLYRTEFPFIVRSDFPSEEEQLIIYRKINQKLEGKPITYRTLDIGGDKVLSYYPDQHKEKNPFLGMRSIRFSLEHSDIFRQQLRAILRAGTDMPLRIMFPMISSLDDFIKAKELALDCVADLRKNAVNCHDDPAIGMMIETPAVIEIIDDLAEAADFFSIGTNDFIQYMLAVDRTNEKVAPYYLPYHPSILRAMKKIADAAFAYKTDVSVCGDMVNDVQYLKFFIGIGIYKFSLNPGYLPKAQKAIESFDSEEAAEFAGALLKNSRIADIHKILSTK